MSVEGPSKKRQRSAKQLPIRSRSRQSRRRASTSRSYAAVLTPRASVLRAMQEPAASSSSSHVRSVSRASGAATETQEVDPASILATIQFPKSIEEWDALQAAVFAGHTPIRKGWIRCWSRSRKSVYYTRTRDNYSVCNIAKVT